MKKFYLLTKTLLVVVSLLVGGASSVWGDVVVPIPLYLQTFNDASAVSDFGGTIIGGQGQLTTSTDARFGKYYQNLPNASAATQRTNYLKIVPANNPWSELNTAITSGEAPTNAFTISMWVNTKIGNSNAIDGYWSPLMIACKDNDGTIPTTPFGPQLLAFGGIHINSNGYVDYQLEDSEAGGQIYTNGLATNGWHHIVWIFSKLNTTSFGYTIYVDGEAKLSTDLTFNGTNALGMLNDLNCIVLGSTASAAYWDWNDNAFAYDDIAIYSEALSAEQISQIITNKLHYTVNAVDGSSNILKVLADANSSTTPVSVTYPRFILDGTTLREAAATDSKYTKSIELTSSNQTSTISYTNSSVSNVYYYAEGEDVLTTSKTYEAQSLSMSKIGYTAGNATFVKLTTLPAGTWTITARYFCGNTSGAHKAYIKVGSEVKWSQEYADGGGGNTEKSSASFTLTEPTDLYVAADGGNVTGFDWLYVSGTPNSTIVGKLDYSTDYLVEMSDKVTLAPGQSWHYKFVNHNMGSTAGMAQNWVLPVYASDGTTKKIVIRSDNWEDIKWANTGFGWTTSSGNWYDNFVTEMDNATVDMTVNYSSTNVLTMSATITTSTDRTLTYTYNSSTAGVSLSDNIKMAVSVSHSWLELIESWPPAVPATIGTYGWATFSSAYALDFSKATEGLEAYMITGHEGNVVTKSQVTGTVPAGTGLLLKGDEGSYTIPVVGSSDTDVSGNKLVAGTGASVSAEEGKTKYVLGVNNNSTPSDDSDDFAEFQKIVSTPATVAAGKAYLQFNEVISGARALRMSFGDETAVENVKAAAETMAKKNGTYLENGKIAIYKNGVKFNVAGQQMK